MWAVNFDKISKPFPMEIRQVVRVDQIVKEQVADWKKRRDVNPIMGYLYDEFEKRKQQAHIVDLSGFFDLVFKIHREMHKACTIQA